MGTRNLTLSLPDDLVREAKVVAARRRTSVSAMVTEALQTIVEQESGYTQARATFRDLVESGISLGTEGVISWDRDSLHERS